MKDRKKLEILKTKEQIVSKRTSEGKFWNVNNIGITCRYRVSRYLYKYFLSGILDIFNLPGLFVKFKNNFWLRYDQARMILFWKKSAALPFIYLHPRFPRLHCDLYPTRTIFTKSNEIFNYLIFNVHYV